MHEEAGSADTLKKAWKDLDNLRPKVDTSGTVVYSLRIPPSVRDAFEQIAEEQGLRTAQVVREAMFEFVARRVAATDVTMPDPEPLKVTIGR